MRVLKDLQREQICKSVSESHGSLEELAKILDLAIEMLFYLEEDTFDRREVQSVVSVLKVVINFLR